MKNNEQHNEENNVNKYAACSRCANNGCRYRPKCDGFSYWKMRLESPVIFNVKEQKAREYRKKYYQEHKAELREKRRKYFLKYYHEVLKKNPDEVTRRRLRGLKYYYDHHEEIRAKRNAKKRAEWADPEKGPQVRKEHTEYMREYRKKKKESITTDKKENK